MYRLELYDWEYGGIIKTLHYSFIKDARQEAENHLKKFMQYLQSQGDEPEDHNYKTWNEMIRDIIYNDGMLDEVFSIEYI